MPFDGLPHVIGHGASPVTVEEGLVPFPQRLGPVDAFWQGDLFLSEHPSDEVHADMPPVGSVIYGTRIPEAVVVAEYGGLPERYLPVGTTQVVKRLRDGERRYREPLPPDGNVVWMGLL